MRRLALFFALFAALFLLRLAYGYHTTPGEPRTASSRERAGVVDFLESKKNYASDRYLQKGGGGRQPEAAIDQKYEKTASMTTLTDQFEQDGAAAREVVGKFGGIVQYEQNSGRPGSWARVLQLTIGVQPEKFDEFCEVLKSIGRIETLSVTKADKTNEFLDLKAQRASLETARNALNELKGLQGNVDEFVNLQFRILEVDRQLQELGVKLGDYDEVNEFCTVRFTLYESRDVVILPPGLPYRLFTAFTWTVKYYLAMVAALAFFSVLTHCSLAIAERVKKWGAGPK